MKLIPLSKGKAFAKIDDEDFEKVSEFTWSLSSHGYAVRNRPSGTIYMHQLIAGYLPDHRDGDGLNNQKNNLRPTNHSLNAANHGPKRGKKFRGTCWDKSKKKWLSAIFKDGKSYFIGRFNTEEEAARAYDRKARELYGEYAFQNFA